MGAIPSTEVAAWLDLQGLRDQVVRRDYHDVIRVVDRAYLANRSTWETAQGDDETQGQENQGEANRGKNSGKR